jgi:hypothetical protein
MGFLLRGRREAGVTVSAASPVRTAATPKPCTPTAHPQDVCCGIRTNGTLACWGSPATSRGLLRPPAGQYAQVSVSCTPGGTHACAVAHGDGALACWGGIFSQGGATTGAGGGAAASASVYRRQGPYLQVASGGDVTCAIRAADASLDCFGEAERLWGSPSAPPAAAKALRRAAFMEVSIQ